MVNEPDHYRVLGINPQAPRSEIQAAYRRRLRVTHPDRGGDMDEFHLVQGAWETLSHPGLRREYDLLRFGRRAARRYRKAAAPSHRKVRGWNATPASIVRICRELRGLWQERTPELLATLRFFHLG
ncbi:J domain-containing protein [Glycomyces buryatensis]|uniref:J domain-containing protein n=1 Tax=Glycomyces buryatensis TaxID=2570927 RepID=A0A4S8QCJ7_9ACTN|nr:J domain-containing protein [Glycomyces buryatensis]THV42253.1 J domain-containing protein [Glycomyces buryatensis]